jgi:hypothetical protein
MLPQQRRTLGRGITALESTQTWDTRLRLLLQPVSGMPMVSSRAVLHFVRSPNIIADEIYVGKFDPDIGTYG